MDKSHKNEELSLRSTAFASAQGHDRKERELSSTRDVLQQQLRDLAQQRVVFQAALSGIADAVITTDSGGRITSLNPVAESLTGWKSSEAIGQPLATVLSVITEINHATSDPVADVLRAGNRATMLKDGVLIGRGGMQTPIEQRAVLVQDEAGKSTGMVVVLRDLTEWRRGKQGMQGSEDDLGASDTRSRVWLGGEKDYAIFALDVNGFIVSWNSGAERIKGYRAEEIIGQHFSRFYPEPDLKQGKPARVLETAKATGRFEEKGWRVRKDGTHFWASVVITALYDEQGKLAGFSKITRDITEWQRAEEKLRQSEEKFSKAFQSSPLAVTISTVAEGRYIDANEAFFRIVGSEREQVIGKTAADLNLWAQPEDRANLIRQLEETGRGAVLETVFNSKTHGRRSVQVFAEPIQLDGIPCIVAVTEDVTEARTLEAQYRQAQKMEATGRLAGGIAHDFNNVLNVILGYCELLLERVLAEDPARKQIQQIETAARRASDLTRQLLAFGRQQVMQARVLSLNSVISEMSDMLRRLIGEDIEITTSLSEALWPIKADPTQVVQTVMNLVVNARDAMPAGGKVIIETGNARLNGKYVEQHVQVAPGDYARLVVTDTGTGMDEETKAHIFEPFYTTKEMGKGTGLGLATVYGIVKQSGGFIWVYSEPGQGTAFKVYFPRAEAAIKDDVAAPVISRDTRGTETIFVLEDNDQLRELAVEFLQSSGYSVLESGDPEKALEIAAQHEGPIHLLVTDVVLPKMSGRVMAEKLNQVRPGTKVLFVSGYTDDVVVRHGVLHQGVAFLQKPFTRDDLTTKVRTVLESELGLE